MKQSLISTYTTHITAVSAFLRTSQKRKNIMTSWPGSCRRGCLNPSRKRLVVLRRLRINRALCSVRSVHRANYTDFHYASISLNSMLWKQKSRGSLSWLITCTISRFHEFNCLLSHVKANRSPDGTQTVGDTWPGSSEENEDRPTTDLWEDDVYKKTIIITVVTKG